jgi:hypothetical protein
MERTSTQALGKPRGVYFDNKSMKEAVPLFIWELELAERIGLF